MPNLFKSLFKRFKSGAFFPGYMRFRSSIYVRVVYIIAILSFVLFISFGAIFNSVYQEYLDTMIRQRGNDVGSIIEGSLYYSMLQNDNNALQSTLDIINTISGVDEVNLYDHENELVYSSHFADTVVHGNPNCISCHLDFNTMFPHNEKTYRIIDIESACNMQSDGVGHRQLLIR